MLRLDTLYVITEYVIRVPMKDRMVLTAKGKLSGFNAWSFHVRLTSSRYISLGILLCIPP